MLSERASAHHIVCTVLRFDCSTGSLCITAFSISNVQFDWLLVISLLTLMHRIHYAHSTSARHPRCAEH